MIIINCKGYDIPNNLELAEPWQEFLSMDDFATLIQRDPSVIRRHIASGKLVEGTDCVKYGKQWVINAPRAIKALNDYSGKWNEYRYTWDSYIKACKRDLTARGKEEPK